MLKENVHLGTSFTGSLRVRLSKEILAQSGILPGCFVEIVSEPGQITIQRAAEQPKPMEYLAAKSVRQDLNLGDPKQGTSEYVNDVNVLEGLPDSIQRGLDDINRGSKDIKTSFLVRK